MNLDSAGAADESFNYEISDRVIDNLKDFTSEITRTTSVALLEINWKKINFDRFNIDDKKQLANIFNLITYNYQGRIVTMQAAFESYFYIFSSYFTKATGSFPSGISYSFITTPPYITSGWSLSTNGEPDTLLYDGQNASYFKYLTRPWYIQGKKSNTLLWSAPFLDFTELQPQISLVAPIFNLSVSGTFYKFAGVLAANVRLDAIGSHLKEVYSRTVYNVFIVDQKSGYLMGTSLDARLYASMNGITTGMIRAIESENPIISSATSLLINKGWPKMLLILGSNYLESTLYIDKVNGINWYVVVLMPAALEVDHLGPDSIYYSIVIFMASLSIFISLTSFILILKYWNSRIIQLSQPQFTLGVFIGCILLAISCFLFLGENNLNNCIRKVFIFNISWTVAFCPILIRSWRVYVMFVYKFRASALVHGGSRKLIHSYSLFLSILAFVIVDIIIIVTTMFAAGGSNLEYGLNPYTLTKKSNNGAYASFIYCGYHENDTFFFSVLAYKCTLVFIACYLTVATRSISDVVAGNRVTLAIVYNTAIIGGITIAISRSLQNTNAPLAILIEMVGLCFCLIIASVLHTGPLIYKVIYVGDAEAADHVIDEMFQFRLKAIQWRWEWQIIPIAVIIRTTH